MNPRASVLLVVTAAALGGVAMAVVFDVPGGLLIAGLMLGTGAPTLALAHLFARRRSHAGPLPRQFALGTGLAVGLVLVSIAVIAALMFVSAHDAFTLALLLAFAGALAVYSAVLVAGGVLRDIESVRDGVMAVGEGRRDVRLETSADDEMAELAQAVNVMIGQLADREAERDQLDAARRGLLAAVSHDLRTPLASLRVLAEAIESDVVDAETRRRYVQQLSIHIDSIGGLIDDLFELARLEAGEVEWSMQRVRVEEVIEETVEAMQAQARVKEVATRATLAPDLPAAHANPEKVQRVLFNLIDNAIRHTPPGGTVTVSARAGDPHLEVEVADSGEGILPDDYDRAFEPFWRGGTQSPRTRAGGGLGLTICRAIVEAHGGRIWLEEADPGTRVRFSLPLAW